MLSSVFFEKAVWAFFALVASLIAVIYKLFNGSLQKDLRIQKELIKEELETRFETRFNRKIENLETEVNKLRYEIESFKNHEKNNALNQSKLLKRVLFKLDAHDSESFDEDADES